jgi:predicted Zn-dependent protease
VKKNYSPSRQAQGGDYYLDSELQSYVAGVGKKLATYSAQPELTLRVRSAQQFSSQCLGSAGG